MPYHALVFWKPIANSDKPKAIKISTSSRLIQGFREYSGLGKSSVLCNALVRGIAASDSNIGSNPGNNLKRSPSGIASPRPLQNLFLLSTESQWRGDAEPLFTSSMLRLKPYS